MKLIWALLLVAGFSVQALALDFGDGASGKTDAIGVACTDCVDGTDLADTITLDAPLTVSGSSVTVSSHVTIGGTLTADTSLTVNIAATTTTITSDGVAAGGFAFVGSSFNDGVYPTAACCGNLGLFTGGSSRLTVTNTGVSATVPFTATANSVVDVQNPSFGAVTAGSTSTLTWTEVTDRLTEFNSSSFTATYAGYYEVIARAEVSQTAGSACLLLKVNNVMPAGGDSCNQGVTGLLSVLELNLPRILNLAASDVVRIDGSATTADGTFQKMKMTIKRVP